VGLTYRDYASPILDRGVRLSGMVLMLSGPILEHEIAILRKLETLRDCRMMVCSLGMGAALETRLQAMRAQLWDSSQIRDKESLGLAIQRWAAQEDLSPSAIFMVGTTDKERLTAKWAGLGLFVDAQRFFRA